MNGLITIPSAFPVKETIDRLASILEREEWNIFARIDHAEHAQRQGLQLRPTELLIFGNPKVGTSLMLEKQTSGIDLPTKVLAWQDEQGRTWLTYNDMSWLQNRHALTDESAAAIRAIENGMVSASLLSGTFEMNSGVFEQ